MNVFVVDPWYFTPPYDQQLCHGLLGAGHQVHLVTTTDDDDTVEADFSDIRFLPLFSKPAKWLPRPLQLAIKGLEHIRGMVRLYAALRRSRPDVIHFQWLSLPLIDTLFLPFFKRIAPIVLTVHDSNPFNGAGPWLLRAGSAFAMLRCDHFIVHNQFSVQRLAERGVPNDRIHQIAHGLLEEPATEVTRRPVEENGPVHFLQFGKLKEYKGADIFLNALASLEPDERKKCHAAIVGRPYIETQPLFDLVAEHDLQDAVDLRFDFVSDAEMVELFDRTDYLVFPYRDIDTSGVLMVAVARGIPVIASDIGCFSEILNNDEEGKLVPPGDVKALAQVIRQLVREPERQALMTTKMETLRSRIPSWNAIAKSTTNVYQRAQAKTESQPLGASI